LQIIRLVVQALQASDTINRRTMRRNIEQNYSNLARISRVFCIQSSFEFCNIPRSIISPTEFFATDYSLPAFTNLYQRLHHLREYNLITSSRIGQISGYIQKVVYRAEWKADRRPWTIFCDEALAHIRNRADRRVSVPRTSTYGGMNIRARESWIPPACRYWILKEGTREHVYSRGGCLRRAYATHPKTSAGGQATSRAARTRLSLRRLVRVSAKNEKNLMYSWRKSRGEKWIMSK